ncbi:DUF1186 domain-containing protein [Desulfosarcina sp. OttesenSCG-928-B08]|nr:DUF1186 domain-containing protein [Desulfosarcina sp. OttesenSCG-928-B08]
MNIQDIVEQLSFPPDDEVPVEALRAAASQKEEITPLLLDILEKSIDRIEEIAESDYMGHLHAMLLLAQFREPRAYPLIVRFFSAPDGIAMDATGDIGAEFLEQMLVSVCHGDDTLIKQMVENDAVDESIRVCAIYALTGMVATAQAPRESVVAYLTSLLRTASPETAGMLAFFYEEVINNLVDLYPEEAYPDIADAVKRGIVDPNEIDMAWVDSCLSEEKEVALFRLKLRDLYVGDAAEELEASLRLGKMFDEAGDGDDDYEDDEPDLPLSRWGEPDESRRPVSVKKIGRNEPCPCGSGKKYKKCCGA